MSRLAQPLRQLPPNDATRTTAMYQDERRHSCLPSSDPLRGKLSHRHDHHIATKAQHQAAPFGLQTHDDAVVILQPEIAGTGITDRKAHPSLHIVSGELRNV